MSLNCIVEVRDRNVEGALIRLKKWALQTGFFRDLRRRSQYIKPGERRRLKSLEARKKQRTKARRIAVWDAAHESK